MGKVLIIKNNNEDSRIYQFAEKSYIEKKIGYYNTLDGSLNEKGVQELKERFDGDGLWVDFLYPILTKQNAHRAERQVQDMYNN